jgi:hypothetical protein
MMTDDHIPSTPQSPFQSATEGDIECDPVSGLPKEDELKPQSETDGSPKTTSKTEAGE